MKSLFKTEEGKNEILSLYDQKLDKLNIDSEYIQVETSFGKTNIIATGDVSNPSMVIIHGSNGCAPIALETYPNLSKSFRVFAVDVIAQPNKSAETRPSMNDDSYGKWMNEVIDQLNITDVTLAGFSFGGLIILKTLEHDESRIKEVYLSAPAYIVNGNPLAALFKVFIPMRRFMKSKKTRHVEKFLSNLFTERDEFALAFLQKVIAEFEMDFTPVPTIDSVKAKKITTPITIFAAKEDVLFPGRKMIKRASSIFPSLKESHLIEDSKHVQNKAQNKIIEEAILKKNDD
ncbi:alpha/beta hydrolase [Cryomorphaceae bacterium 1068]|nr:alpha/beta hydrolase [Cryomorphaceae bacterium 1068]